MKILLKLWVALSALAVSSGSPAANVSDAHSDTNPTRRPALVASKATYAAIVASARAGSRTVAVGDYGTILLSDDGQDFRQARDAPTSSLLTGVVFVDDRRGWAVGHDGVILGTNDAGDTWKLLRSDPERDQTLLSVWFENPSRGIAVGQFGLVLETLDGGVTWSRVEVSGEEGPLDFHLNQIFSDENGSIYIVGEAGLVLRSDSNGKQWTPTGTGNRGSLWAGMSLSSGTIVVVGMRGHLYRSENRGSTWQRLDAGTTEALTDLVELPSGELVIVGLGGTVLRSRDDAVTFELETRRDRAALTAVSAGADQLHLFSLAGIAGDEAE